MPHHADYYVAVAGKSPVYHVVEAGEPGVVCGAEIAADLNLIKIERIEPALFQTRYEVCLECEAPVVVEPEAAAAPPVPELVPPPEPVRTAQDLMARVATEYGHYLYSRHQAVGAYLRAGELLLAVRKDVQHGDWIPLLDEFGLSETTALRMMKLYGLYELDSDAVLRDGGIVRSLQKSGGDEDEGQSANLTDLVPPEPNGEPEESESMKDDSTVEAPPDPDPPYGIEETLDALESENRDLRHEVIELRQEEEPSKPKVPTRTALQAELTGLAEALEAAEVTVGWWETEGWRLKAEDEGWTPPHTALIPR